MKIQNHGFQQFVRLLMVAVFTLSSLSSPVSQAQSTTQTNTGIDVSPPVISMDEVESGIVGEVQVFSVEVEEDNALESVKLYYRFAGDPVYESVDMDSVAGTGFYKASLPTSGIEATAIEYYVQARDVGGNRAVKGFPFDPLVRELEAATRPSTQTPAVALSDAQPTQSETEAPIVTTSASDVLEDEGGLDRRVVWGVAGLLAVALLASLAGGGSDSSPAPDNATPITIEVTPVN